MKGVYSCAVNDLLCKAHYTCYGPLNFMTADLLISLIIYM